MRHFLCALHRVKWVPWPNFDAYCPLETWQIWSRLQTISFKEIHFKTVGYCRPACYHLKCIQIVCSILKQMYGWEQGLFMLYALNFYVSTLHLPPNRYHKYGEYKLMVSPGVTSTRGSRNMGLGGWSKVRPHGNRCQLAANLMEFLCQQGLIRTRLANPVLVWGGDGIITSFEELLGVIIYSCRHHGKCILIKEAIYALEGVRVRVTIAPPFYFLNCGFRMCIEINC